MHAGFIAVDWGTTNRRAYRLSGDGRVEASCADAVGVMSVPPGDFPRAVADLRDRMGEGVMLIAGMIGSNRGWIDVPYVTAPAGLADLAAALHWVVPEVGIVPGISIDEAGRTDVMRGEEMQVLGAVAAGLVASDATVCHPGTHAKWITLDAGRISRFATAMTGEIFALLKDHSILAPQLGARVVAGPAFCEGVDLALSGAPLLESLFSVRSRMLLGHLDAGDAASYASGILIGSDIASHVGPAQGTIALIGRSDLCALYATAIGRSGRPCEAIAGDDAFIAGMTRLYGMIAS